MLYVDFVPQISIVHSEDFICKYCCEFQDWQIFSFVWSEASIDLVLQLLNIVPFYSNRFYENDASSNHVVKIK